MAGNIWGEMTGSFSDEMNDVEDRLMVKKTKRETGKKKEVTSADGVSIRTGENIATAGDTHEELPSAIAQTKDSYVSEKTLQDLSEHIGICWKYIGRKLNLTDEHLENLDIGYSSNHKEKVYQMLLVWKRKRGIAATYDVLADALKSAGRPDLVTSADKGPIHTGQNINKDEGDSHSMRAESMIGKDGGTLDIQNTGVCLQIPPGALRRDYFVQMRIIPYYDRDETELSFASYPSVVVELLPNNVKLLKPATLTLPHCLVLKKKCEWKAKVYSSHHKEGNQPQWEEESKTQCDVTYENCVMRLHNFCWMKVKIDGHKVKAMKIRLFAAKRSHNENEIFLDIGYYWDLPSFKEFIKLNHAIVLHDRPFVFYKKGHLPLTILQKELPPIWTYNEENKEKIIKFSTVANVEGDFCTFLLKKGVSDETDGCACFFKAGQGENLADLMFSLKESRTEAITPSSGNATAGDTEEIAASDESLREMSKKIGKFWRDVGRNLKLTEEQLDNLEHKGYPTLNETIYQMLHVWKCKRARAATYDVLGDALRKADRVDLQEYLLDKYKPT